MGPKQDIREVLVSRLYAGSAVMAIVGLLGVSAYILVFADRGNDPFAKCRSSAIATGGEQIGGPFTLVDQSGVTVTEAQVFDKPALVYFGYTSCTDVCPLDNARNAQAVDILEEQGFDAVPVFITIDPERDTPAVMADYGSAIHPRMVALSGSAAQVKAAAAAYRVYYKAQPADAGGYEMDHSTFTYLVLPKIGFVEFFRREVTADQVANSAVCFIQSE